MKLWHITGKMEWIYFEYCDCPHCRSHKNSEFLDVDLQVQAEDEQAALDLALSQMKQNKGDDGDLEWWTWEIKELVVVE